MIALLLAGGLAFTITLLGTPVFMKLLHRRGVGQNIRDDGPASHKGKEGTPTMGGVVIIGGAMVGYLVAHLREGAVFSRAGLLTMFVVTGGAALVGFADDVLKFRNRRSLGLRTKPKMALLVLVAVVFAILVERYTQVQTTISLTRYDLPGIDVPTPVWIGLAVFMVIATTNAVNLTDGLDGLAAGSSAVAFVAFTVIAFWQFKYSCVYGVPTALDLSMVAIAMAGACAGFLWWNAAPARIFMGDTGSLGIGAAIAGLAIVTNTQLLLLLLGGLFVAEAASVIVQVLVFKLTGQRVFRMAPMHHHFELGGWPETTVIIRLWIVAAMFAAGAAGIFYADFQRLDVNERQNNCPIWVAPDDAPTSEVPQ